MIKWSSAFEIEPFEPNIGIDRSYNSVSESRARPTTLHCSNSKIPKQNLKDGNTRGKKDKR